MERALDGPVRNDGIGLEGGGRPAMMPTCRWPP